MNKQPKLMNYSRMRDILTTHADLLHRHAFISNELGMVYGDPRIFQLVISQGQPPFVIDDYRLGIFASGEARISINLVERHITASTLVFLGPGTIISPVSFSDTLVVYGIGLFADFPMPFATGQMPPAFNGQVRDFQIPACEGNLATARRIIDTIWHTVHQPDYNRPTVSSLVAALMHHYDSLYRKHTDLQQATLSREQAIFNRFIYLVNRHATEQHQIAFYADRLCITERYLGTVVRQASGITAKEWIDRAIITRIKVELRHTDKSVVQISEEMNFPNPSFFNKYFKRIVGQTPLAYRDTIAN